MSRQVILSGLIAAMVLCSLTACGGDGSADGRGASSSASRSGGPAGAGASSATGQASQPAGGRRVGGNANGVALVLPPGWTEVDPSTDTSPVVSTSFSVQGEMADLVKSLLAKQKRSGVIFAIDGAARSGFAPHLQSGCERGGLTGSELDELKVKTKALHAGARITDLTVSGRRAFRAAYTSKAGGSTVTTDVVMIRVPVPGEKYCFLQVEAKQGELPAQLDQMLSSFALT